MQNSPYSVCPLGRCCVVGLPTVSVEEGVVGTCAHGRIEESEHCPRGVKYANSCWIVVPCRYSVIPTLVVRSEETRPAG